MTEQVEPRRDAETTQPVPVVTERGEVRAASDEEAMTVAHAPDAHGLGIGNPNSRTGFEPAPSGERTAGPGWGANPPTPVGGPGGNAATAPRSDDLSSPAGSVPVGSAPVGTGPVDSAPVDSAPVDSAPVDSAPVDSAPLGSAALRPSVRPPAPARPSASGTSRPAGRGRRAQLSLRRIDPRSAFVLSLLLSLFLALVTIVAAFVLYSALGSLGVPASINTAIAEVRGGGPVLTSSRFVGGAALLAAVNVVLITVLSTLGALLYNVCASFTGGIAVTLTERE